MRKHVEESVATGVAARRGRGGRFSAGRKREVVMRLRGEDLESVSRAVGITAARASHWRAQFLAAGQAGLKSRAPDARDDDHRRLQAKIAADGDRVTVREGGPAGGRRPFGPAEVDAMSGAQSISTRRAYRAGLPRVALRPLHARRQATRSPARCRRRGPIGAAPDDVLVAHIRRVLEASPFHGEGYRKAWAKLRVAGMDLEGAGAPVDARARPPSPAARGPRAWAEGARRDHHHRDARRDVGHRHDGHRDGRQGAAFVFVAVDHCATACIGLHAAKRGTRFEALEPIRQGIRERFGGIGAGVARGLRLLTTTGRTTWPTIFNRRSRSSASKAPRASCGSPKATASRSDPHAEGESVVGAELRDDRGAPPGLARVQAHTTSSGCWRSTTTEARPRCDALLGLDAAA